MRFTNLMAVAATGVSAACAGFAVQGQKTPFGAALPTPERPAAPSTAARAGAKGAQSRVVCRTTGVESGWIAVDYVNDTRACGSSAVTNKAHPAALIVNYRLENVGDELDVCADQMTPNGWVVSEWLADDGRCPDDLPPGAAPTEHATVKRIRCIS